VRIAILSPGYGWVARGVEVFIHDLVHRLIKRRPDWHFDIYTRGPAGQEGPNVRLIHIPAFSRYSRLATLYAQIGHHLGFYLRTRISAECLSFAIALAPVLWFRRYNLIFNQAGWFAGWLLVAKRRRDGTPFVHKTAGGYSYGELMLARQRPDILFATSPVVHDWLRREVWGTDSVIAPNGVDSSLFCPEAVDTRRFKPNPPTIEKVDVLFVGAMDEMKRPDLAIRAVAATPGLRLRMIGEGRLQDEMQRLGTERFQLIPRVENAELPPYYCSARVFTLPSDEPFGIVFLEAMACNVPVVGRDTPVTRWLIGDAGLTCDCDDIAAYVAALETAMDQDFGDRPRLRALEFDWERIVTIYEQQFAPFA